MVFTVPRPKAAALYQEQETETLAQETTDLGRTMSASESETTLEAKLEALQCHFTWDLDSSRSQLFILRDMLEDIGTGEGNSWLGHIYNLLGYIHYRLGSTDEARSFLSRAAEAFCQMKNTVSDEGPWLVVNCGNRAWLHYQQGEEAESRACLSKVDALTTDYPPPSQDELHPEIYAEKAWTLMKIHSKRLEAVDFFQRAIRMQPDVVEWQTSHVLALVSVFKNSNKNKKLGDDILEKMRIAKEHDPKNLYLAALYLEARASQGEKVEEEARELAREVLKKPVSSYSGIKPLLRLYSICVSMDEAIDLAEEALERHPGARYLKSCASLCYNRRILVHRDVPPERSMLERAVSLAREVISLYPDSTLKSKLSLASIQAQSAHSQAAADQLYEELLESDLDPNGEQILYNYYAKHLHYTHREIHKSIKYHMRAAAMPQQSFYRENSISILERIRERNRNRMCGEIEEFLANLQR